MNMQTRTTHEYANHISWTYISIASAYHSLMEETITLMNMQTGPTYEYANQNHSNNIKSTATNMQITSINHISWDAEIIPH